MAGKETPLQTVKRLYGDKDKLVDTVVASLNEFGEQADDLRERLVTSSNQKLLRLAQNAKTVKDKFGGRDQLTAAVAQAAGKARDSDYVAALGNLSLNELLGKLSTRKAA